MSTNTQIISESLNANLPPEFHGGLSEFAALVEEERQRRARYRADCQATGKPYDFIECFAHGCLEKGKRCQSQTSKGQQCKHKAGVYHQHTDGEGYFACSQHARDGFRPCKPPQQADTLN